ncbi:F0F1 ATP synthase subunit A [Roseobacter sp. HKCCA0434]|uniref:F0F1 ATP synthase subunit A n=1 Tax=Roseobacter sp. HKCCA0434 TaxID=3079297 RepID=UPI002905C9C0|nr:F0F1 ATP synthase subunit A [Roseobacter sp. HKCCA0434]
MDQFIVSSLDGETPVGFGGIWMITNQMIWLTITVLCIAALFVLGSRGRAMVPSRIQSVGEMIYGFVYKMIEDVAGKEATRYMPHIMTLFTFILFANLLALIPTSFSVTSHIAATGVLALLVFVGVTVLGFVRNGAGFLKLFWPSDAPGWLKPILAVIELISYFVRPVSHSIRLAANLMAGHAVLKVFAGFAGGLAVLTFGPGAIVPILGITAIYGLELLVAVIQAYVFTILTCVYLHDAFHPGH